jgi:Flp pilus assembly protein TadG
MSSPLCRFVGDRSGLAFIELAVTLPVMVALFLGTFETARLVRTYMKLANAAQNLAELVAVQTTIASSDMNSFCSAARLVMAPISGSNLAAAVASVTKSQDTGTIGTDWTDTTCKTSSNGAATVSTTSANSLLVNNGDSVIIVTATYAYQSPIKFILKGNFTLSQSAFARPRHTNVTHS